MGVLEQQKYLHMLIYKLRYILKGTGAEMETEVRYSGRAGGQCGVGWVFDVAGRGLYRPEGRSVPLEANRIQRTDHLLHQ
jgi:hypothetical protein